MIIKKPYAFLIKHFRLIHLLLSISILYLVYKTNDVFVFFNDYVKNGFYTLNNSLNGGYINFYMFLAVIFVIALASFIYLLMKWKNKNRLLYISICIYYFCVFISYLVYFNAFQSIFNTLLDIRTVRLYRDIMLIMYFPQYLFLIFSIIRAIGFDIKKFDFKKDYEELDIAEEDQEETEITFGENTYKYKRTLRKIIREIKYYAVENKFFFGTICGVLGLIVIFVVYFNFSVFSKKYHESEFFMVDGVRFSVINSYVSDVNIKGEKIKENKKYVVVKVSMENTEVKRINLSTNNLRLLIGNKAYHPIYTIGEEFKDLGEVFYKNTLYGGEKYEYLFIYEVPKNENLDRAYFSLLDNVNVIRGEISSSHKDVRLNVLEYMKEEDVSEYSLGEAISLEKSSLLNSEIIINSYELGNQFTENYTYCIDTCYIGKKIISPDNLGINERTIMKLNMDIDIDKNLYVNKYLTKNSDFVNLFGSISYVIDGETKYSNIIVKTLENVETKNAYIEVPSEIKKASNINLIFDIRNKKYIIKLTNQI